MDTNNHCIDFNPPVSGYHDITPSEGETILGLLFPFLWDRKVELGRVSIVNKRLHGISQEYIYYHTDHVFPRVSLDGSVARIPRMVEMYMPPRIILAPGGISLPMVMSEERALRCIFPMPAAKQPRVHRDPREMDVFQSMTWSEKSNAILEYAARVGLLYLDVHPKDERFVNFFFSDNEDGRLVLGRDLINPNGCALFFGHTTNIFLFLYPTFCWALDDEERCKVKVCFYERMFKDMFPPSSVLNDCYMQTSLSFLEHVEKNTSFLTFFVAEVQTLVAANERNASP